MTFKRAARLAVIPWAVVSLVWVVICFLLSTEIGWLEAAKRGCVAICVTYATIVLLILRFSQILDRVSK